MDKKRFLDIVKTFADSPDAVTLERAQMIFELQSNLITLQISQLNGILFVTEDGVQERAEVWICKRLANLDLLARKIIDTTPDTSNYIEPSGRFIDVLERAPLDVDASTKEAFNLLEHQINSKDCFGTYVIYLTSDAGEGKTTTIQHLARKMAIDFLNHRSDSLVVPIYLAGQPFIRLDDMIIGSVANTYRFRNLYIESFVELVKMGVIIPAFDGFEEMFVVSSSGEAVSSLGNFLKRLDSSGTALVSARTAYFEIRDFSVQDRLFDGLNAGTVSFSRLKLDRWDKDRFLKYWAGRNLSNGGDVWGRLSEKFKTESHPLLTRAVLVKKLADIAQNPALFDKLIEDVSSRASSYFVALIDSIIEREQTKWLERTESSVSTPLLNIQQHHELLSEIAGEMVTASDEEISFDTLVTIASLYCEDHGFSHEITRQVIARIPDHPLLRKVAANKKSFVFDHEEFKDFFTGEAIGRFISSRNISSYKGILRNAVTTPSVVDACLAYLKSEDQKIEDYIDFVKKSMLGEDQTSLVRESGARILAKLIALNEWGSTIEITQCSFESEAFKETNLCNIRFLNCYFYRFDISSSDIKRCEFTNCEFSTFAWNSQTKVKESIIHKDCKVYEAYNGRDDLAVFSPKRIAKLISEIGFTVEELSNKEIEDNVETELDPLLSITERALRAYHRSNGVCDDVFQKRLRTHYSKFSSDILPRLARSGILSVDHSRGEGFQNYYKLSIEMSSIQNAINSSGGSFENFLQIIESKDK